MLGGAWRYFEVRGGDKGREEERKERNDASMTNGNFNERTSPAAAAAAKMNTRAVAVYH